MAAKKGFLIGKVAARTGIAVSAIRHYEDIGLIRSERNAGGQRVFLASDIRRISFIIIAQNLGFTLAQIKQQFDGLPDNRTPTKKDWARISSSFGREIDDRIAALTLMREKLTSCIGCGCLSLKSCALYNAEDRASRLGPGPRYLLGDKPA
ncbi:MAG: redox-sensitive transcriptional activator SoxR [Hyphomonadaceae bacterium]|nr:redox-sensitive transcriptional activator SoxR [Hyphomonadaceae bacterium]